MFEYAWKISLIAIIFIVYCTAAARFWIWRGYDEDHAEPAAILSLFIILYIGAIIT